tara:strand:- start:705 stop:4865 length:4161 start_codon:yes stop_codon:yes gene_type:complete
MPIDGADAPPPGAGVQPGGFNPNLPLPERFDINAAGPNQADKWTKWYRRFQRYRHASGLSGKSDVDQVSTFLYAMGDTGDDILITLKHIDEEKCTYAEITKTFDDYFTDRLNVIVERAKFNTRKQSPSESIDVFIQDLYKLADTCDYGTLKEQLIRDRIVVGVLSDRLSDHLQNKADLTLAQAVKLCRQAEERNQNKPLIRGAAASAPQVNYVKTQHAKRNAQKHASSGSGNNRSKQGHRPNPGQFNKQSGSGSACMWCGKEQHERKYCPARNVTCNKCSKPGHYSVVCRGGKSVNEVDDENCYVDLDHDSLSDDDADVPFLGEIYAVDGRDLADDDDYWSENVNVNNNNTHFKLDSGAKVTVLSEHLPWVKGQKLDTNTSQLYGPGRIKLPVVGKFMATLQYGDVKLNEDVYVIKHQKCSLLSRNACHRLGLIARVNEVHTQAESGPNFREEFPSLFTGLGKVKDQYTYHITLRDNSRPVCLYTPRRIPHPLLPKVKSEIDKMVKQGVISPVKSPTEWCSGIVCVPKSNGAVRICVDLTALNKSVHREIHPMSSVDESLAKLGSSQSQVFSKLDANSGFWQIPLNAQSRLLTTFVTPFGRYCFNRLPFGISSAPEIYQRMMSEVLDGLDGVICHMDDILIHSSSHEQHAKHVRTVLQRLAEAGITLNNKCEFFKQRIKFLGCIVDSTGLQADPDKTSSITKFPAPTTVTELQRFMGMVNQLGKFIPGLAELTEPMRQLLRKDTAWYWGTEQERSFQEVKKILVSPSVLAHYNPQRPTIIAADASSFGIGAVLMQVADDGKQRRPIAYASRSLTDTEQRYAVIEKEALAATWACEKFSDYVLGLDFLLETDHKPLVPLLSSKELAKMPPRIQRFRLRMMRFSPRIEHVPGKHQVIADSLSRAPTGLPSEDDLMLIAEVEAYADSIVSTMPASEQRLHQLIREQKADETCMRIREYCTTGWPAYLPHLPLLRPYWENRGHFGIVEDMLLYDDRLVIPQSMRLDILESIHQGHLGVSKCRSRARISVWWPGMSKTIEEMVTKCVTCAINRPESKEPLMPSSLPDRPWQRIGSDLFHFQGQTHLIVVDYYSRWLEIKKLKDETSESVIIALKELFAQHGIPELVISDNGPQYSANQFQQFAADYGFNHVTSSPHYPQANGEAERAVRTVKALLRKNQDIYLALLTYRATPLQNGFSPSELLMGRKLRTQLPMLPSKLLPAIPQPISEKESKYRHDQQQHYNDRHRARELSALHPGDNVYLRDRKQDGEVLSRSQEPRSYLVKTMDGTVFRRNRAAIVYTGTTSKHHQMTEQVTGEQTTPVTSKVNKTVNSDDRRQGAPVVRKPGSPTKTLPPPSLPATPKTPEKTVSSPSLHTRTRVIKPPVRFNDYVK